MGKKAKSILNDNPIENYRYIIKQIKKWKKVSKSYNEIAVIYRFYKDL